jgi:hypothetical protein
MTATDRARNFHWAFLLTLLRIDDGRALGSTMGWNGVEERAWRGGPDGSRVTQPTGGCRGRASAEARGRNRPHGPRNAGHGGQPLWFWSPRDLPPRSTQHPLQTAPTASPASPSEPPTSLPRLGRNWSCSAGPVANKEMGAYRRQDDRRLALQPVWVTFNMAGTRHKAGTRTNTAAGLLPLVATARARCGPLPKRGPACEHYGSRTASVPPLLRAAPLRIVPLSAPCHLAAPPHNRLQLRSCRMEGREGGAPPSSWQQPGENIGDVVLSSLSFHCSRFLCSVRTLLLRPLHYVSPRRS